MYIFRNDFNLRTGNSVIRSLSKSGINTFFKKRKSLFAINLVSFLLKKNQHGKKKFKNDFTKCRMSEECNV